MLQASRCLNDEEKTKDKHCASVCDEISNSFPGYSCNHPVGLTKKKTSIWPFTAQCTFRDGGLPPNPWLLFLCVCVCVCVMCLRSPKSTISCIVCMHEMLYVCSTNCLLPESMGKCFFNEVISTSCRVRYVRIERGNATTFTQRHAPSVRMKLILPTLRRTAQDCKTRPGWFILLLSSASSDERYVYLF